MSHPTWYRPAALQPMQRCAPRPSLHFERALTTARAPASRGYVLRLFPTRGEKSAGGGLGRLSAPAAGASSRRRMSAWSQPIIE